MHLDAKTIDGYLARSLDRNELRRLDHHVGTCLHCTLVVEQAATDDRWERRGVLGRLVRAA